jgi:ATP-dependent Lon protease
MKELLERLLRGGKVDESTSVPKNLDSEELLRKQAGALLGMLANLWGPEKLVLKAGKLDALTLMKSDHLENQVLALQRLILEDPTLDRVPARPQIKAILDELESIVAEMAARRTVEDVIEKKIQQRMQERQDEYYKEIKQQVLKEDGGPETSTTQKRLAQLQALEEKGLSRTTLEAIRPASLDQIVGQERATRALLARLASPFPQHLILYGPPGVGKTTAARLALEAAKRLAHSPFAPDAPFVEVDGTTIRWDPREVTNPLLGSVHDPIYQGARRDMADTGVPEPKTGLVTEAHGGVLFIDEIGELEPMLQNKLLKVLEDKRVKFESSYYDANDPNVPAYVRYLFEHGAPADFILIGATTRDPSELNPALRSRCAEVFFEPLTPESIADVVRGAAERLGVQLEEGVAERIGEYTTEGRKATGLLADAYGLAMFKQQMAALEPETSLGEVAATIEPGLSLNRDKPTIITMADLIEVIQMGRISPNVHRKAKETAEIGRIFGLGVSGYMGSTLEIEAVAFPAREKGKGTMRFNDTAGSMAKDSVFNAAAVVRKATGEDLSNWDIHVNIVGGGKIDGPSAGVAIYLAMISAIQGRPIRQDVAITGEVSIRGQVKAIGGVYEKIYGAKQAGMSRVILPEENRGDVPAVVPAIEVCFANTIEEAMQLAFAE